MYRNFQPVLRPITSFQPGALAALQQHAVQTAPSPSVGKAIGLLPPDVILHLANTGAAAAGATAGQILAGQGSPGPASALGGGLVDVSGAMGDAPALAQLWANTVAMDPRVGGLSRTRYPAIPLPAQITTDGTGSGVWTFTPTEDVVVYRLVIPSAQGFPAAASVGNVIANGRLVNVASNVGTTPNCFSEKSRGGRIGIDRVKAGTPITVQLTGATAATTYYACMLCFGLQHPKDDGTLPPPDAMGYLPIGNTAIAANSSTTITSTPVCLFRPRLFVFDESLANFSSVLITSLTSGVMVEEASSSASIPAAIYSTLADDDFEDFDPIPRNTPISIGAKNTNAAAANLAGHILGECWFKL